MRWPWVGVRRFESVVAGVTAMATRCEEELVRERQRLESERQEVRRLTDVIIKMRRRAFDHLDPKKPSTPPDVDAAAVQRAEHQGVRRHARATFMSRAVADLVQKGANPVAAEQEAQRLWEETSDLHPAGG